jgi:dolichyl-diphosphooligosaccharide--protein glycosyltransferase
MKPTAAKSVHLSEQTSKQSSVLFLGLISLPSWVTTITWMVVNLARLGLLLWILERAYEIRTYAIRDYGAVIHEFDPWFNFRATQYLEREGWTKFFSWFDYQSWYPLGRPVGTTIYPGMQITSVAIYRALGWLSATFNQPSLALSLNDVCVYVPAWFGSLATLCLALLTYECSGACAPVFFFTLNSK